MWFWLLGIGALALLFGSKAAHAAGASTPSEGGPPGLPPITPGVMLPPYQFVPGVPYKLTLGLADPTMKVVPTLSDAEADLQASGFQIVTLSGGAGAVPGMSAFVARVVPTAPLVDDGLPGTTPTGLRSLMYDVEVALDTGAPSDQQQLLGALGGLAPMLGA